MYDKLVNPGMNAAKRAARPVLAAMMAVAVCGLALAPQQPARAQAGDHLAKETAGRLYKWTEKKVKEAYKEYKAMREAQKEQKQAEQRLQSQKDFAEGWKRRNSQLIEQKKKEIHAEVKRDVEKQKKAGGKK